MFYCLAMLEFAGSTSITDFYFARFLQGIGASMMWVSARTIVADVSVAEARGKAMGRLTTTSVRGSMIGAFYGFTLLGFMPLQTAWMWAFGGYAVMALLALIWSLLQSNDWVKRWLDPRVDDETSQFTMTHCFVSPARLATMTQRAPPLNGSSSTVISIMLQFSILN